MYFSGSGFSLNAPLDPKEVGKVLTKLGKFTPHEVLDVARNPKSPLHKYFEWEDSKAAEAYRLYQARNLVLSIKIEDDSGESYRAFESVVIDEHKMYVPMKTISDSPDLMEQVLHSILNELIYWRSKHQKYKHIFGGVFDAIDDAEEALRKKNEKDQGNKARSAKQRRKGDDTSNQKANSDDNNRGRYAAHGKRLRGKIKKGNARKADKDGKGRQGSKRPSERSRGSAISIA